MTPEDELLAAARALLNGPTSAAWVRLRSAIAACEQEEAEGKTEKRPLKHLAKQAPCGCYYQPLSVERPSNVDHDKWCGDVEVERDPAGSNGG